MSLSISNFKYRAATRAQIRQGLAAMGGVVLGAALAGGGLTWPLGLAGGLLALAVLLTTGRRRTAAGTRPAAVPKPTAAPSELRVNPFFDFLLDGPGSR